MKPYLHTTLALMLTVLSPVVLAGALDRDWVRVESSHFNVYSAISEDETIEIVWQLELTRAAIEKVPPPGMQAVPELAEIWVFAKDGDLDKVGFPRRWRAPKPGGDVKTAALIVTIGNDRSHVDAAVIRYGDYVMRTLTSPADPDWYVFGWSSLYTEADIVDGKFRFGLLDPVRYYTRKSNWSPTVDVVANRGLSNLDAGWQGNYLSLSYLLMHYLLFDPDRAGTFSTNYREYSRLVAAGAAHRDAFEDAFQVAPKKLRLTLLEYLREDCCLYPVIPVAELVVEFDPSVSPVTDGAIAYGLAMLSIGLERPDLAEDWIALALVHDDVRESAEKLRQRLRSTEP